MNKIEQSHIKLLKINGIDLNKITNDNVDIKLIGMKTTKGQPLSGNYLTSILNTIKKINGSKVTINKSQLSWKRHRSKKSRMSAEFLNSIANILKYVYRYKSNEDVPETLSMIDTIIAILFLTSTNIKTKDIYDVSLDEFNKLYSNFNEHLVINGIKIIASPLLATQAFKKIEALLMYKSAKFEHIATKAFKKEKKIRLTQYLISTAVTQINRNLLKLNLMLNFQNITGHLKNPCTCGGINNSTDFVRNNTDDYTERPKSLGLNVFRNFKHEMIYNIIST